MANTNSTFSVQTTSECIILLRLLCQEQLFEQHNEDAQCKHSRRSLFPGLQSIR